MKKILLNTLIITTSSSLLLTAQVFNPKAPIGSGINGNQGGNNGNNNGGNTYIANEQNQGESPHGMEIPIVDPTNKTIKFQGRTYSMADNNIGGQFEAFLATDTLSSQAAMEYRATIRQIIKYISPQSPGGPKLKPAYDLLTKAAKYPGDGNICESLANSIYSALLTKKGIGNKKVLINKLNKERKRLIRNMDVISSKLEVETSKKRNKRGGTTTTRKTGQQSTEYIMMQKRLLEIEAIKRKLETEGLIDLTQSKLQYQAMMVQLFIQRRFQHVIMSARFYNLIFKDGDTKMRIKKGSDIDTFFSEGVGVNPTVAGMDAAASEAIRKVEVLVSAFNNNMKTHRIHAASERLAEAFIIGEYLAVTQTIPAEPKAKIQQYVQDLNDMVKTLESHDLAKAERLNESLKKQAADYNDSEVHSYISAMKTASKAAVMDAQMALYQLKTATDSQEKRNQEIRFKRSMAKAIKSWPSNPEIEALSNSIRKLITDGNQALDKLQIARNDFDNWKKTSAWGAIFNDQGRLGGAFGFSSAAEDKIRLAELKEIIQNKGAIIAALKEAEAYSSKNLYAAAWEIIDRTQKKYQNDIDLADAKAKYSGAAAEFSNAISRAQRLEKENPASASAMNWYLKAKTISPDSTYAKEGINRILDAKLGVKPKNQDNSSEENQ